MPDDVTELEGCVLGIVHTRGPVTAYAIRRELRASPSSYWSASAGAVYPLVERLQRHGLLRVHRSTWGRGTRQAFTLSARGRRALEGWIGPAATVDVSVTFDPIRTRVLFLAALPRRRWPTFFRDARRGLTGALRDLRHVLRGSGALTPLERLALEGGIAELTTRLDWVRRAERRLLGSGRRTGKEERTE